MLTSLFKSSLSVGLEIFSGPAGGATEGVGHCTNTYIVFLASCSGKTSEITSVGSSSSGEATSVKVIFFCLSTDERVIATRKRVRSFAGKLKPFSFLMSFFSSSTDLFEPIWTEKVFEIAFRLLQDLHQLK